MNVLSSLEYLKRFFREVVDGRRDYENLLSTRIGNYSVIYDCLSFLIINIFMYAAHPNEIGFKRLIMKYIVDYCVLDDRSLHS